MKEKGSGQDWLLAIKKYDLADAINKFYVMRYMHICVLIHIYKHIILHN